MPAHQPNALPFAATALLLAACATGAPRTPPRPGPAAECVVAANDAGDSLARSAAGTTASAPTAAQRSSASAAGAANGAAIKVAVITLLDTAHAPWPRNAGERLLFAQLYEPLVRLDCTGAVVPGIARSWTRDSTSTPAVAQWSFVLRNEARFGNGERVRAADVLSGWRASADAHSREPAGSLISAIASGARAVDDTTLVIALPDSLADVRAFASPELAVARQSSAGSSWPDGTTSYYVDAALGRSASAASATLPVVTEIALRTRGGAAPLLFQVEPDADRRDILDAGADVLITSSPAAVQYARTQESRAAIHLPWTRSFVLVLPARGGDHPGADCVNADLRPLRDALATAVHVEARGADGPCWWKTGRSDHATLGRPDTRSRRILYPVHDATARELAERIVALVAPGREEPATAALRRAVPELFEAGGWGAAGLDSLHFAESLARGSEGAYVLALPRAPAWPAAARASLLAAAPWLAPLGHSESLVPLVDTRETLLIRRARGIPRMTILHDGTIIFGAPDGGSAGSVP